MEIDQIQNEFIDNRTTTQEVNQRLLSIIDLIPNDDTTMANDKIRTAHQSDNPIENVINQELSPLINENSTDSVKRLSLEFDNQLVSTSDNLNGVSNGVSSNQTCEKEPQHDNQSEISVLNRVPEKNQIKLRKSILQEAKASAWKSPSQKNDAKSKNKKNLHFVDDTQKVNSKRVNCANSNSNRAWERLTNPQQDETLRYLFDDTDFTRSTDQNGGKSSDASRNFAKDGKSIKRSPTVYDVKVASRISPTKDLIKANRSSVKLFSSRTTRNASKFSNTSRTPYRLLTSDNSMSENAQLSDETSNDSTSKNCDDHQISKIIHTIDQELPGMLGDDAKARIANCFNELLNRAVAEGVKKAFRSGYQKFKKDFAADHPSF